VARALLAIIIGVILTAMVLFAGRLARAEKAGGPDAATRPSGVASVGAAAYLGPNI
jgi:hypothetical protein